MVGRLIQSAVNFVVLIGLTLLLPLFCMAAWLWGSKDEPWLMKVLFCVLSPFCTCLWYILLSHPDPQGGGGKPMRITREVFAVLFGAHIPEWSPSAWVKGTRYEFVGGSAEIDELERLCGGVTSGGIEINPANRR